MVWCRVWHLSTSWRSLDVAGDVRATSRHSVQTRSVHYFRFIHDGHRSGHWRKRKIYRMLTAEDPAESQALALQRAADELGSSDYVFGDYSFTFLVFARSLKALDHYCPVDRERTVSKHF